MDIGAQISKANKLKMDDQGSRKWFPESKS